MALIDSVTSAIQQVIPQITNTSASAIWYRLAEAITQVMQTYMLELTNTQQTLTQQAMSLRVGRPDYYIQKAKEWQPDGELSVDPTTGAWVYAEQGDTLVSQAAITVSGSYLILSVAKTDSSGALEQLTTDELAALSQYMELFAFAGISISVISLPADIISGSLVISYDPTYSLDQIKSGVIAALTNTQNSYNLFSPVYVNKLEQQVEAVPGVVNAFFGSVMVSDPQSGSVNYYNNRVYLPAGYFNFSEDLLNGTSITYNATDNEQAV